MADVFVSYASEDRERIRPLVEALDARGWSVWWDREIVPGKSFDRSIQDAIGEAACVVAVWTESSIDSEWVQTEAMDGLNRGILVPVLLDNVEMPLAFRRTQAANLAAWPASSQSAAEFDRLIGGIESVLGTEGVTAPPATQSTTDPQAGSVREKGVSRRLIWSGLSLAILAAVALGLVLAGVVPGPSSEETISDEVGSPLPSGRSLAAVLPFTTIGESEALAALADAMSEDLITVLSESAGLPIVSPGSVARYREETPDIRQAGRALGSRFVVESTVSGTDDLARITIRLIEAEGGSQLWSERYELGLNAELAVRDELIQQIVADLNGVLMAAEVARVRRIPLDELDSWEIHVRTWGIDLSSERKLELIERGIEADPTYALLHARRGYLLGAMIGRNQREDPEADRLAALRDLNMAIRFAPNDAEVLAWASQGYGSLGESEQAVLLAERAVTLGPRISKFHRAYGTALLQLGRADEAVEEMLTAIRLEPRSNALANWTRVLANAFLIAGRYEEAVDTIRQSITLAPTSGASWATLASALGSLGRFEEARAAIRQAAANDEDFSVALELERTRRFFATEDLAQTWTSGLRAAGIE